MFIAFYGINNIGKTFHAELLVKKLNAMGKKAVYVKYPIYDLAPTGPLLNKILRESKKQKMTEEELQLWFVLNRYQFQPQLKKMLAKGIIVVAEDYIGTGIAWGMAKSKNPAHAQKHFENMNKFLVQEDVAIYMDGTRRLSSKEQKHLHEANDALIEKCKKIMQKLAKKYGWTRVKVADEKEVTAERIWAALKNYL